MPQEREISISTISRVKEIDNTSKMEIFFDMNLPDTTSTISEFESEPDVLRCEIPNEVVVQDSVRSLENELIVSKKENVDLSIDINGNLLLLHEKSSKYKINDLGELEYIFNQ